MVAHGSCACPRSGLGDLRLDFVYGGSCDAGADGQSVPCADRLVADLMGGIFGKHSPQSTGDLLGRQVQIQQVPYIAPQGGRGIQFAFAARGHTANSIRLLGKARLISRRFCPNTAPQLAADGRGSTLQLSGNPAAATAAQPLAHNETTFFNAQMSSPCLGLHRSTLLQVKRCTWN